MALEQALTLRQPASGLIIHAERGSQDTSLACRTRIEKAQALASYSRPGNPSDNALPGTTQAEAGWSTLKTELLSNGGAVASLAEARLEVVDYLDTYFNLRLPPLRPKLPLAAPIRTRPPNQHILAYCPFSLDHPSSGACG